MHQNEESVPPIPDEYRYLKPCSAQDCTGLIPAGPVDERELEDYEELYPFLPKVPKGTKYQEAKG
ncbi:MAG: hypothetical protein KH452_01395 [Clostridiales bacterium]|nr:hypothetical protein [Clostridiales bacterium]